MSDISIPGVSSRYNTSKMIDDLMEVERTRLTRLETQKEDQQTEKKNWQRVNRYMGDLSTASQSLFGFDNPFAERIAESSNEAALTATVDRGVTPSIREITVLQTAQADRFQSSSLDSDFEIREGTYTFLVGDEEISFSFDGGDLEDFVSRLNNRAEGVVRGSVIRNTADTKVLLISSLKTGAANPLFFKDDAQRLAIETGILTRKPPDQTGFNLEKSSLQTEDPTQVSSSGDTVSVAPGGTARIPLPEPVDLSESMRLTFQSRFLEQAAAAAQEMPAGPTLPGTPGISYGGIDLESHPYDVDLPDVAPPPPPPPEDTQKVLTAGGSRVEAPLSDLPDTNEFTEVDIPIGEYLRDIAWLQIDNSGNTHREVQIKEPRIYDPSARGEFIPAHPLSTARDAKISLDGVEVIRSENEINDLLDGVRLTLRRASQDPVELTITPHNEHIKESIINFVGYYNQLLTEINILTTDNDEVIQEVGYFTDDERDEAEERLGAFRGDLTLNQMKSRLQQIMMSAYPTRDGAEMALLSQIGISTNASGGGQGFDASRLRGYLEINEEDLDEALTGENEALKELFGNDTDNDNIVDSGAGYQIHNYLSPYLQTGGILDSKFRRLDNQIKETDEDIEDYKVHLEDYEQELRIKYGQMEGTLQQMEQQMQRIEGMRPSDQ